MTIRLQIWTKSARTQLKSADHEARAAFFASITGAEERHRKRGQIQSWLVKARKGARLRTWQWQVLATVFSSSEKQLWREADFFSPLWEMSFSTRPWQFSNDGRLDTISVTHEKRDSDRFFFFFSWRICQRQYECMIAAAAERPIWHSVCITARLPWNCPEVAMWWPLAKAQSRWLRGSTSKSDSVNLLLWHACTERAPDYP